MEWIDTGVEQISRISHTPIYQTALLITLVIIIVTLCIALFTLVYYMCRIGKITAERKTDLHKQALEILGKALAEKHIVDSTFDALYRFTEEKYRSHFWE